MSPVLHCTVKRETAPEAILQGFEQSKSTPPLSVRNPSILLQQPVQQEEQAVLRGSQQAGSTQKLDTDVWSYKPAWCQPYTIIGTGLAVIGGMWGFTGGSMVWTAAGSVPVIAWWYLFLIIYPAQFKEYAEGINTERQEH